MTASAALCSAAASALCLPPALAVALMPEGAAGEALCFGKQVRSNM